MEIDPLRKSVNGHLIPRNLVPAAVDLNRNWWRTNGNDYSEIESQAFCWAWAGFKRHYAIADDELSSVDPGRWAEIPDRGSSISSSDKWPDEWAE